MANVHPWFANVSATDGAGWTADFFKTTDVDAANALPNKPQMYIAETGGVLPELIIYTNLTPEWYYAGWPTVTNVQLRSKCYKINTLFRNLRMLAMQAMVLQLHRRLIYR